MERVHTVGPQPADASATCLMLHGRGASAADILSLYAHLDVDRVAAMAPDAPGRTWYPRSFMASLSENQPALDAAVERIDGLINGLLRDGVAIEHIALLGFSQGACLALEYVIRHPRPYGAVMALTGGYIGPPGPERAASGRLDGVPVFLGANDPDPHVPFERVRETEALLRRMGAAVEVKRYPGEPHAVNADELRICRGILMRISGGSGA